MRLILTVIPHISEGDPVLCLACGRSFVYRYEPTDWRNGRFCSWNCQGAYDRGVTHSEDVARYTYEFDKVHKGEKMRMRGDGFEFACLGCGKPFVSKGLRYCSVGCEREYRHKQEIVTTIKESGVAVDTKRRACECCGGLMPRFNRGKKTSTKKRFCSVVCGDRFRRMTHDGR